jgi:DNA-binding beta-propeller fold protein YncE
MTTMTKHSRNIVPLLALLAVTLLPSANAQRMPQDNWYLASQFGGSIEGGVFHFPNAIAVGPDGNLYVTDRYNGRIQVFDQSGNFLRKWGTIGSGNGQFNEPVGIAVKADGTVYVSEFNNNRVQVFDNQGNFLRIIGTPGSGNGQLGQTHGVALDAAGNIYVCDYGNGRIMVFNPDGSYKTQWGSNGDEKGQFRGPIALCYNPKTDSIAVWQDGGDRRIQVFDTNGNYQFRMGGDNFSLFGFGLTMDAAGNYYAASREWNGVWKFDAKGNQITNWGQNGGGNGPSQFNPWGIAIANDKAFIVDWQN